MDESLSQTAADLQIDDEAGAGFVEIPPILRREVIGPHELSAVRIARQHRRTVIVAVGGKAALFVQIDRAELPPVIRIPWSAVAGAVVEQIQIRIEGEPTPDGAAATLPGVAIPGVERGIGQLVVFIERFEARADADFVVWARCCRSASACCLSRCCKP